MSTTNAWRRAERWLFMLLLFAGSYFYYATDYDNTASRLYMISSAVDFGLLSIDPYATMTVDKSECNGHTYSNKGIGSPLLALPVYWLCRHVPPFSAQPVLSVPARYAIRLFTTTLPFAVLGVVLLRLARRWGAAPKPAAAMVLAFGLGSVALLHAAMFSGHGMAATFAFFAFAGLYRLRMRLAGSDRGSAPDREDGGSAPTPPLEGECPLQTSHSQGCGRDACFASSGSLTSSASVSAAPRDERSGEGVALPSGVWGSAPVLAFFLGLSAGIAALCDYTVMYMALVLSVYVLLVRFPWRVRLAFYAGGAVCVMTLMAFNWHSFGSPLSMAYGHLTEKQWAAESRQGVFGVGLPKLQPLIGLLVSPGRGLLTIMPFFVLAGMGLWRMFRVRRDLRLEALVILAVSVGQVLIISGWYGWHGGWVYGPRYLVPMLPFLAVALVFVPWEPLAWGLTVAVSAIQVNLAAISVPHTPEQIANPLRELIIPLHFDGYWNESWATWCGLHPLLGIWLYVLLLPLLVWLFWRRLPAVAGHASGWIRQPRLLAIVLVWLALVVIRLNTVETRLGPEVAPVPKWREMLLMHLRSRDALLKGVQDSAEKYRVEHAKCGTR